MTEPREMLTEETPESPEDFRQRQLTELNGATRLRAQQKVLTEDLPEEEQIGPSTLLG